MISAQEARDNLQKWSEYNFEKFFKEAEEAIKSTSTYNTSLTIDVALKDGYSCPCNNDIKKIKEYLSSFGYQIGWKPTTTYRWGYFIISWGEND